jgi:hypothetical protein
MGSGLRFAFGALRRGTVTGGLHAVVSSEYAESPMSLQSDDYYFGWTRAAITTGSQWLSRVRGGCELRESG